MMFAVRGRRRASTRLWLVIAVMLATPGLSLAAEPTLDDIRTMQDVVRRQGLAALVGAAQLNHWQAPVMPSAWHVAHVSAADRRPYYDAARDLGLTILDAVDALAPAMLVDDQGELLRQATTLIDLAYWLGGSAGYENLILSRQARDVAITGLARRVIDVRTPLDETVRQLQRCRAPFDGPITRGKVLNFEAGAALFLDPASDEALSAIWNEREMARIGREIMALPTPAPSEARGDESYNFLRRLFAWTGVAAALPQAIEAFFKDDPPSVSSTTRATWNAKRHKQLLGGFMTTRLESIETLIRFRAAVGEFPRQPKIRRETISTPMEEAFSDAWEPHRGSDRFNIGGAVAGLVEEIERRAFVDADSAERRARVFIYQPRSVLYSTAADAKRVMVPPGEAAAEPRAPSAARYAYLMTERGEGVRLDLQSHAVVRRWNLWSLPAVVWLFAMGPTPYEQPAATWTVSYLTTAQHGELLLVLLSTSAPAAIHSWIKHRLLVLHLPDLSLMAHEDFVADAIERLRVSADDSHVFVTYTDRDHGGPMRDPWAQPEEATDRVVEALALPSDDDVPPTQRVIAREPLAAARVRSAGVAAAGTPDPETLADLEEQVMLSGDATARVRVDVSPLWDGESGAPLWAHGVDPSRARAEFTKAGRLVYVAPSRTTGEGVVWAVDLASSRLGVPILAPSHFRILLTGDGEHVAILPMTKPVDNASRPTYTGDVILYDAMRGTVQRRAHVALLAGAPLGRGAIELTPDAAALLMVSHGALMRADLGKDTTQRIDTRADYLEEPLCAFAE